MLNLRDKKGNLSGKEFNWSLFGLNDEQGKIDESILKKISNGLQHGSISADQLKNAMERLSPEAYKTAKAINMSGQPTEKMSKAFGDASKNVEKMTLTSKAATLGMKALSVAMNIGIMLAVSVAIKGLELLITSEQRTIDKANELSESWKQQQDTFKSNKSNLEDLKGEFAELSKGVDENGENVKLSAEQYQRYKDIVKQIVDMSPAVVTGYNAEGDAIVDNNTAIEEAIRLQKELNEQKRKDYLSQGSSIVKGARNELRSQYTEMISMREDINKNFSITPPLWGLVE